MATQIQVPGLCTVKIKVGSDAIEVVGYNRNVADVSEEAYFVNVPGDENGGDEGPPIDVQIMGETARIRLELTKWDTVGVDKIRARVAGGVAGTPPTAGTLMFQGDKAIRLILHTVNLPMNFPRAFPRDVIEHGKGTKFETLVCLFEAHKDATGVLYDATVV